MEQQTEMDDLVRRLRQRLVRGRSETFDKHVDDLVNRLRQRLIRGKSETFDEYETRRQGERNMAAEAIEHQMAEIAVIYLDLQCCRGRIGSLQGENEQLRARIKELEGLVEKLEDQVENPPDDSGPR